MVMLVDCDLFSVMLFWLKVIVSEVEDEDEPTEKVMLWHPRLAPHTVKVPEPDTLPVRVI